MPYPKFDRSGLHIKKLSERKNKVDIVRDHVSPDHIPLNLSDDASRKIGKAANKIRSARKKQRPVIMAFGAHTIKNGLAPVLNALLEEGWITHLSTNGAGIIHDWEFAYQGKSSENVRENVDKGQFGIWEETGFCINLALVVGAYEGLGYGESVGKMIEKEGLEIPSSKVLYSRAEKEAAADPETAAAAIDLAGVIGNFKLKSGWMKIPHPFKKYSVQAAAYKMGIPFTGHPMFGHDIIYTHPLNHGAAIGRTALRDFLSYAQSVSRIDDGVYISLGSAVMSPMIFEKSLSMAQNVSLGKNSHIDHHYMVIADISSSDWDWKQGEPPQDNPAYYLRFSKTFSRMGGEMDYVTADNRDFLLELYRKLKNQNNGQE